jgi:signal transduction histidine kinase
MDARRGFDLRAPRDERDRGAPVGAARQQGAGEGGDAVAGESAEARLAAGLAHAVRNPLNGAGLHLSIVERELAKMHASGSPAGEALAVVRSELGRLSSFITDFVELARPVRVIRAPADLNELARRVVLQLSPTARSRDVELRAELAPTAVTASIDAERVERALGHLVQNGLDAAGSGGAASGGAATKGTVIVRIFGAETAVRRGAASNETVSRGAAPHGTVGFDVEDDGPGLEREDLPIFEPFCTTKARGTGLGLAVARHAVEAHGGELTYARALARTVFSIRLPAPAGSSRK